MDIRRGTSGRPQQSMGRIACHGVAERELVCHQKTDKIPDRPGALPCDAVVQTIGSGLVFAAKTRGLPPGRVISWSS